MHKIDNPFDWITGAHKAEPILPFRQKIKNQNPDLWHSQFPEIIEVNGKDAWPEPWMGCPLWRPMTGFSRLLARKTYAKKESVCQKLAEDYGIDPEDLGLHVTESPYPWRIISKSWSQKGENISFFYYIPALIDESLEDFWQNLLGKHTPPGAAPVFDGNVLYEVTYPDSAIDQLEQFLSMLLCKGMHSLEKQWVMLGGVV